MSHPYFIELYNATDNSFINKFKFVLNGQTVKEVRELIIEKLSTKGHIEKNEKIVIKDNDEYQLGSDDQVSDVIPDGKVKIYVTRKVQPKDNASNEPQKKQQQPNVSQQQVASNSQQQPVQAVQQQPTNQNNIGNVPNKNSQDVTNATMQIDTTSLKIPIVEIDTKDNVLRVIIPQIRKSVISIQLTETFANFYEFSSYIVKTLNLSQDLKAILYTKNGIPFVFNLDLLLTSFPKLNYNDEYYIVLTKSIASGDSVLSAPMESKANPVLLKIHKQSALLPMDIKFQIDLSNTVGLLKHKVYELTKIHPLNQILKFGTNTLTNDLEILSTYNLQTDSIIQLNFKQNSNISPASLTDKFFYKDVKMINEQNQLSIECFRSHMIVLAAHIKQEDRAKFLYCLEKYSKNMPLVYGMKTLFENVFLSQASRIAIEEGLYGCILEFLKHLKVLPQGIKRQDMFLYLRNFLGFIIEAMSKISKIGQSINEYHASINIQDTCTFTLKTIKNPRFVKIDDGQTILVDKQSMHEQIDKGFTFDYYKKPNKSDLKTSEELENIWEIFFSNHIDNQSFTMVYWIGTEKKQDDIVMIFPDLENAQINTYVPKINTYPNLQISEPIQMKNKVHSYLLLKTKQNRFRVFVSKNKDISKPYNLFDPITGNEQAVNLDLMSGATRTQNTQVPIDIKQLKPVITREPKQAIVVLFDISGSMSCKYFNEPDLIRIGAVKSFFQAFAYRTIAYNLEHVVSLIFFDNKIQVQCDFTEAIYDFNRLISDAKPRGSTRLYDTIIHASEQLAGFGKKYPECKLRILALTDGQDTASNSTFVDAARSVIKNKIIMDSFAVGASCEGLKNVTIATGGKCYLTRSLEESLKLFEQQTVLSVRNRSQEDLQPNLPVEQLLEKAKYKAFDQVNGVHKFKMPTVKASNQSRQDIVKKLESAQQIKKMSGNNSMKRLSKQIQQYTKDPHPFIAIYPCEDIYMWKILLLGPKDTPYENGLFLLYARFPQDYPFRAPEVRFTTPIYHCNMNSQGRICHSVFDRNYSPALKFKNIMDCVYGLILTPEPEDPLDNVVATFYLSDYQVYLKNAKQATLKNASNTAENLVEQLYGNITDDIERQKKIKQLEDWITEAKKNN